MKKPDFIYGGRPNWTLHEIRQCQAPFPDHNCNQCGHMFYEEELGLSEDGEMLCEQCRAECSVCEAVVREEETNGYGMCCICQEEAIPCNTGIKAR